jgi:uncharacterized protein (DUF952 family)
MSLFHLVEADVWARARAAGHYDGSSRGMSLAEQGFVHLSHADQVAGTLQRYYTDAPGPLLLLVVDPARLTAELRIENGFPHLYGPLPLDAVVQELAVEPGPDGWISPVS